MLTQVRNIVSWPLLSQKNVILLFIKQYIFSYINQIQTTKKIRISSGIVLFTGKFKFTNLNPHQPILRISIKNINFNQLQSASTHINQFLTILTNFYHHTKKNQSISTPLNLLQPTLTHFNKIMLTSIYCNSFQHKNTTLT